MHHSRPQFPIRLRPVLWLAALVVPLIALSQVGEASLRRSAGGADIAALLTRGTEVTILERQENWLKVRIEGWIAAEALVDATPGRAPDAVDISADETASQKPLPAGHAADGLRVEGRIRLRIGRRRQADAAGIEVMLLPENFRVELDPSRDQQLALLREEAQQLQRAADRAMQEDNFTRSMARRDALLEQRTGVLDERGDLLATVHGRHEAAARTAALATVIADSQGWFSISGVANGTYTLYTRLVRDRDGIDVEWLEPLTVAGDVVRQDLDASNAIGLLGKRD